MLQETNKLKRGPKQISTQRSVKDEAKQKGAIILAQKQKNNSTSWKNSQVPFPDWSYCNLFLHVNKNIPTQSRTLLVSSIYLFSFLRFVISNRVQPFLQIKKKISLTKKTRECRKSLPRKRKIRTQNNQWNVTILSRSNKNKSETYFIFLSCYFQT